MSLLNQNEVKSIELLLKISKIKYKWLVYWHIPLSYFTFGYISQVQVDQDENINAYFETGEIYKLDERMADLLIEHGFCSKDWAEFWLLDERPAGNTNTEILNNLKKW